MGRVVAIGEPGSLEGFALAGATVVTAGDPTAVRRAWEELPEDVSLVLLTESAADTLRELLGSGEILHAVVPP